MNKKKIIIYLAYVSLAIMLVFFGIIFENKKFYPYLQLKSFYQKVSSFTNKRKIIEENVKIKENDLYNFKETILESENNEIIETSVMRLDKKEFDLTKFFPESMKFKSRGGICNLQEKLVVISASGEGGMLDSNTDKFIYFNLQEHFKNKKIIINIIQDIYCLNKNNNEFNFLINLQKKEESPLIDNNYVGEYTSNIFKVSINNDNIKSELIYKSEKHGINWAGRILVNNNFLYITFSSREANAEGKYEIPLSQDDRYLEGKIIEVNLDNKYTSIFSKGHRNPQGLNINKDGNLIETEHGPKGGDEINFLYRNKNYGWPLVTHGTTYENFKAYDYINTIPGRHNGFEKPIFSWTPGIGISNIFEIKEFDERWDNDLIVGSLKNMSLYRVRVEDGKTLFAERIWIGKRIRDISFNYKNIFLWTDDKRIISLEKSKNTQMTRVVKGYDINVINACLSCHYLQTGERPSKVIAPTLTKIFEKNIASDEYNYSEALKNLSGKWDEVKMASYLLDPQSYAPGTYKSYKISSQNEVFKIIKEIKKLSDSGD